MCHKHSCVRFATTSGVLIILLIVGANTVCFNSSPGCEKCPEHCTFCNSSNYCFSCENGFFGTTCQFSCHNCIPHTECTKDSGVCEVGCREGLSGKRCDKACEIRCESCNKDNALNCLTCKKNQTCKLTCPCVKETCNESYCSEGCLEGYWGDSCQYNCPPECNGGGCRRENGTCFEDPSSKSLLALPLVFTCILITAGGITLVVFWQRKRLRSREEKESQQNTDESGEEQTMMKYTEPDCFSQEHYIGIGQSVDSYESSFNSPIYSTDDQREQYEIVENPNYIPLSTDKRLEDQYLPVKTNVSGEQMCDQEQYETVYR